MRSFSYEIIPLGYDQDVSEQTLYDANGRAVTYIANDNVSIYTWNGKAIAYLDDDEVYSWRGNHIGWFVAGVLYDVRGRRAGFIASKCPSICHVESVKSVQKVQNVKSVQKVARVRAVFSTGLSDSSLLEVLES